ncbi:MAG: DNA primase DnaG [Candidatus Thermoplasmatota archaeon]|nr:DNA primase DnaG [Candidatus Thermoplasmatota archaeon]MCL5791235.1 DNA primase DnaG [Candidatus Thermoplasmatota archaeon]
MNVDPNITKYLIKVKINADGVVEKPDVVGAIFGQTEGLLGEELDLRDLQKSGKIGRIEVEIDSKKGRTEGTVLIPSGLDQVESSILAASLETIDRIGPCKAKVDVEEVEDVRQEKRKKVIERAEQLYKKMSESGKTVSESIIASVREEVERGEIISYGEDKLPAGPAIKDSDAVIVVEGRNDVLNLLKYGIKNTIAVQGTNIPRTVQRLSKERTTTVFLDGDRGGDLILKEMLQVAEVDFVARAPPGTEVEELTYKQIVKALRYKTPTEQYLAMKGMNEDLKNYQERNDKSSEKGEQSKEEPHEKKEHHEHQREQPHSREEKQERREIQRNHIREEHIEESEEEKKRETEEEIVRSEAKVEPPVQKKEFSPEDPDSVKRKLNYLSNSKETEVFNETGMTEGSFPLSEAPEKIESMERVSYVLTGGVISQRLIDICNKKGAKVIYGIRKGNITKKPENMRVVPLEEA